MASLITVERLRSLLKARDLPTDGFKPALVEPCGANALALSACAHDLPPAPGSSPTPDAPASGPPNNSPALASSSAVAGGDGSGLGSNREIGRAALGRTPDEAGNQAGWTAHPGDTEAASSTFSSGVGAPPPISGTTLAPDAGSPNDSGRVGAG